MPAEATHGMLSVRDVAQRLSISTGAVYALCNAGKLKFFRIGAKTGRYRFRPDDVEDYLTSAAGGPRCIPIGDNVNSRRKRGQSSRNGTFEPILLRQAGWQG